MTASTAQAVGTNYVNEKTYRAAAALAFLLLIVNFYAWASALAYLMMAAGVAVRKSDRARHASLMGTAMAIDVTLVLMLEVQRNAVATALAFNLSSLQMAHIAASTVTVLLYVPILALGLYRYAGKGTRESAGTWHMRLGIAAFAFRTLSFLLMFSMLGIHNR